ncbi:MAG: transporter family protein [Halobacteriales archaeon]|jgi:transporter family protein
MNYVVYAVIALVTYGLVAPVVSFAMEEIPSEVAVVVTNTILVGMALTVAVAQDHSFTEYVGHDRFPYLILGGVLLGIGIMAYYKALEMGPVSVVVPVYGMFIALSSIMGFLVFEEVLTARKALGILFGVVAIYLTAG